MKKTSLGLGAIALAASLSLTACGGDEGQLAKEYCEHVENIKDAKSDPDKLQKATKELTDWLEDNKDEKGDADKFTDAVKDECGIDPNDPSSLLGE